MVLQTDLFYRSGGWRCLEYSYIGINLSCKVVSSFHLTLNEELHCNNNSRAILHLVFCFKLYLLSKTSPLLLLLSFLILVIQTVQFCLWMRDGLRSRSAVSEVKDVWEEHSNVSYGHHLPWSGHWGRCSFLRQLYKMLLTFLFMFQWAQ